MELSAADGIWWSVSDKAYDFCRRAEWATGEEAYITYRNGHSFSMSPAPTYGDPQNVTDGISRRWSSNPVHMWIAEKSGPQSIMLSWEQPVTISSLSITFDTLARTFHEMPLDCGERVSPLLVKHYTVEAYIGGEWRQVFEADDNYHRFNKVTTDSITTDRIRVNVLETWGNVPARIYEIRAYQ